MDSKTWDGRRQFAETRFGRIAYVQEGTGSAALFFHGAFLNSYQWRDILPLCADVRRCVAFDNLGHGHTEIAADQPLDLHTQAAAAAALLDSLGIDAADIVGNDTGGAIAQVFAVTYPERVRSLALTNCDVHSNFPPAGFQRTVDGALAGALRGALPRLMDISAARSASGFGRTFQYPERLSEETVAAYVGPLVATEAKAVNFERFVAGMEPGTLERIEPQLKALQVPALIAWGDDDYLFDVEWAHWLAKTLPQARPPVILEGARLFWPEEHPERLSELLHDFWADAATGK